MFYYYYHYHFPFLQQKLYNWAMEKKQKTAIKRLQVVIVIALGSNCPGVTIWGQYNSPRGGNFPAKNSHRTFMKSNRFFVGLS